MDGAGSTLHIVNSVVRRIVLSTKQWVKHQFNQTLRQRGVEMIRVETVFDWQREFVTRPRFNPTPLPAAATSYLTADNPWVWQARGRNAHILAYALSFYYLRSIDRLGLLTKLDEDTMFGTTLSRLPVVRSPATCWIPLRKSTSWSVISRSVPGRTFAFSISGQATAAWRIA